MVTLTLNEVKARPIEEILRQVTDDEETIRIEVSEGKAVELRPAIDGLKPLITFDSRVPEGWKDAIYGS